MKGALTIDAAADYISVSKRHFERHIQPHIPVIRIGARTVVRVAELDRWLEDHAAVRGAE